MDLELVSDFCFLGSYIAYNTRRSCEKGGKAATVFGKNEENLEEKQLKSKDVAV